MTQEGMYTIGELARLQQHDKGVVLVGFGSYAGQVVAGERIDDLFMEHYIGHRGTGVVCHPAYECFGHFLPMRYDAFIYIDQTTALHPLHSKPDGHLVPETYPFGM